MIVTLALLALTLYQQTVKSALEKSFAGTEYLLLDAASGEAIAANWPAADRPVPIGSLVKPLLLAAHTGTLPALHCTGERCWRKKGHGAIGGQRALAESCNEYYEQLATGIPRDRLRSFLERYGLAAPREGGSLIGLRSEWTLSPLRLLQAYRQLASDPRVRAGMVEAAQRGTASAIGTGALAKTGTSQCSHSPKGEGDGYAVAMLPASKPEWALLVRVHGTSGASAARQAGAMVRVIREGK